MFFVSLLLLHTVHYEVAGVLQVAVLPVAPHLAGADPLHRGLHGHLLRLQVIITLLFYPRKLSFELSN